MGPEVGRFIRQVHEAKASRSTWARPSPASRGAWSRSATAPRSTATFSCSASACGRRLRSPKGRGWRSTAASPWMSTSRPACPASSRPATSRGGPILTPATRFASSTGWWPNDRVRPRPGICSVSGNVSMRCRSSGASISTSPSATSDTPKSGMPSRWMGRSRRATARSRYKREGRTLAVATIGRDRQSLESEASMEGSAIIRR